MVVHPIRLAKFDSQKTLDSMSCGISDSLLLPGTLHALHPDARSEGRQWPMEMLDSASQIGCIAERACFDAVTARSPDAHAAGVSYVGDRLA